MEVPPSPRCRGGAHAPRRAAAGHPELRGGAEAAAGRQPGAAQSRAEWSRACHSTANCGEASMNILEHNVAESTGKRKPNSGVPNGRPTATYYASKGKA